MDHCDVVWQLRNIYLHSHTCFSIVWGAFAQSTIFETTHNAHSSHRSHCHFMIKSQCSAGSCATSIYFISSYVCWNTVLGLSSIRLQLNHPLWLQIQCHECGDSFSVLLLIRHPLRITSKATATFLVLLLIRHPLRITWKGTATAA